jgi:osmotically-inducible protein OsmY
VLRFLAFLVLLALVAGGVYYWKSQPGASPLPLQPESLGQVGQKLRDTALQGSVRAALELDRNLRLYAIGIGVGDGVVTLTGSLPDEALRRRAEEVAAAVPDVRQVRNEISLDAGSSPRADSERSLGESFDDKALEVQVRLAFSLRRELKATDIDVTAYRREVTLSGEVPNEEQRRLALEVAGQTAGVAAVVDHIGIQGQTSNAAAADRRPAVERALAGNANLAAYRLVVVATDGRLVLRGRVRTGAEKDLAAALAREAAVGHVENEIQVKP